MLGSCCSTELRPSQCDGEQADHAGAGQDGNSNFRSPLRQKELEHRHGIAESALKWPQRAVAAANDQAHSLNAQDADRQGKHWVPAPGDR